MGNKNVNMLYETLKWPQIAAFCISSKNKFMGGRRGRDPDLQSFVKVIITCTKKNNAVNTKTTFTSSHGK
jgi:hypothetical protein